MKTKSNPIHPKECLKSWIAQNVSDWSRMMDGIVWLDADSKTLVERVRQRHQPHSLKNRNAERRLEFLAGYRFAYEQIISLYQQKGIPVIKLWTRDKGVHAIKNRIVRFVSEMESKVLSDLGKNDG